MMGHVINCLTLHYALGWVEPPSALDSYVGYGLRRVNMLVDDVSILFQVMVTHHHLAIICGSASDYRQIYLVVSWQKSKPATIL